MPQSDCDQSAEGGGEAGNLSALLRSTLGAVAFVKLCEALGGTRVYIPVTISDDHPIAQAIGSEAAERLRRYFYRDTIRIPLGRDERALHYRANGLSMAKIARKLGMTENSISKMFKRLGSI